MLSEMNLGSPIVVPPPRPEGSAVILSNPARSAAFNASAGQIGVSGNSTRPGAVNLGTSVSVPVANALTPASAEDAASSGKIEINGQIGLDIVERANDAASSGKIEINGQIGLDIADMVGSSLSIKMAKS